MKVNISLSAIVPVYNEIELLEKSIAVIDKFLRQSFKDYEIIIIESGSTDGSGKTCDQLSQRYPRLKVIHEGRRNGFGSGLKIGYKNAAKDFVVLVPIDLPFSLETISRGAVLLATYDCVLSYRSRDTRPSLFRKTQSLIYNWLIKIILGLEMKNVNSAFKIFKRGLIQKLSLLSNGWFIDAEILYWLKAKRIKFVEIPVELRNRKAGISTVSQFAMIDILKEMIKFLRVKNKMQKINL